MIAPDDRPKAWRTVAMLCVLYAFSGIDRLILSLLVAPIKMELLISDTQIGILFGLSFALLYTIAGLPLARVADRGNRKRLVAAGVVFWSASTMMSAFARDYPMLLLCRAGVAIGEAVLTPAAISLIADLYPRERRGTPTALFVATGTIFGLSAAAIGGLALALASALSPTFGDMPPWRLTLALVGAPGVVAGIVFALIVREPPRGDIVVATSTRSSHLARNWCFYMPLFAAVGASVMISYALIGWTPALLGRRHGIDPATAGYIFGLVGIVAGGAGTLGTPALARWWGRRRGGDGLLPVGIALSAIALPAVLAAMIASTLPTFVAALAVALAALPGITLLPSLIVQQVTPAAIRGQTMALYLLIANLMGLGCGPALAGLLSDTVFRDRGGMAASLAVLGVGALSLTIVLLAIARAPYRRLLAEAG